MELIIRSDRIYGQVKHYPVNPAARFATELLQQKTLVERDLKILKDMGYTVINTNPMEQ